MTRKADRPETLRQALHWETVKRRYLAAGLCHACAAQAAWGHQAGFAYVSPRPWPDADRRVKPPCGACAPLVAQFPAGGPAGSQWRLLRAGQVSVPENAVVVPDDRQAALAAPPQEAA